MTQNNDLKSGTYAVPRARSRPQRASFRYALMRQQLKRTHRLLGEAYVIMGDLKSVLREAQRSVQLLSEFEEASGIDVALALELHRLHCVPPKGPLS